MAHHALTALSTLYNKRTRPQQDGCAIFIISVLSRPGDDEPVDLHDHAGKIKGRHRYTGIPF